MMSGFVILIISFVVLVIFSISNAIFGFEGIGSIIAPIVICLVPAIYSLIPLVVEFLNKKNKSINRLTSHRFTDRSEDLEALISKLTQKERIFEIKGSSEQCGKTWLAKKLCDSINFPKAKEFNKQKEFKQLKTCYKNAHYIDMANKDENKLNTFFESNRINSKTVLIFDHVTNLSLIFDKQKLYHFHLVYIMKENFEITPHIHHVSPFDKSNIKVLQKKIQEEYSKIDTLTVDEINTLYEMTDGVIGKIHGMISRQDTIAWIKNKASKKSTEYDKILDKIETDLFIGKYMDAKKQLIEFYNKFSNAFAMNNDLYFRYIYIKSDCEHLLNNYDEAHNIIEVLSDKCYQKYNEKNIIELKRAHYLKHQWKCNDALIILSELFTKNISAMTDAFGILLAKYFIDDNLPAYTDKDSLNAFLDLYYVAKNSNIYKSKNDDYKIKRYDAIYEYYKDSPKDPTDMISKVSEIILMYSAENNRLISNAYFMRGELKRVYKMYKEAIKDYQHCLYTSNDDNIRIQANVILYYLKNIEKVKIDKYEITKEQIINLCNNHNNYGIKLIHRLNSIEFNDEGAEHIKKCFQTRIMPIL